MIDCLFSLHKWKANTSNTCEVNYIMVSHFTLNIITDGNFKWYVETVYGNEYEQFYFSNVA